MEIKRACNTPVLTNKIIGSSTVSQSPTGNIENQSIIIDSDYSLYINNSPITITSTEITYSNLGLIDSPVVSASTATNNLSILKDSYDSSIKTTMPSILDNNTKLSSLYDNIISGIHDSLTSKDSISKETYLLLSLQSLTHFINTACDTFLSNNELQSYEDAADFISIVRGLINSLFSISKGVQLLNALIGQSEITPNYASKLCNELSSALLYIESDITGLSKNNNLKINNDTLNLINSLIKQCKELLVIDKTSKILISPFTDSVSLLIDCTNLMIDRLTDLDLSLSYEPLVSIISSLQNITKLIQLAISSISSAYFNINNKYPEIIDKLESACEYAKSISFTSKCPALSTSFSSNILLTKSYSKDLTNTDIRNSSVTGNNSTNSDITESVVLLLSFYVYNLQINISGTIGSDSFTGHIFYPELHNLNFFGINDMIINTEISIPSSTNTFNISQCLTPELKVIGITTSSPYDTATPSTFKADITFGFSVNGEILATALLPLIISK